MDLWTSFPATVMIAMYWQKKIVYKKVQFEKSQC